jgi:hypothetical protein
MTKKTTVCVFCGSRAGNIPAYEQMAVKLGTCIGESGCDMVFGGGNTGLMGAVSQAALRAGARVTGVIPHRLIGIEPPKDNLSELIVVDDMHERKMKMSELADLFVVLPGGIGTYEEAFEVITNNWLRFFHKPVGFLDVSGFYEELFRFLQNSSEKGFIDPACMSLISRDEDPQQLLTKLTEALRRS